MIDSKGFRRYIQLRRFRKEPFWRYPVSKAYLETKSFSEFIRHENIKRALGMKPQTEWILDDNGERIVDFIGKAENLDTDYKILANKIGVKYEPLGVNNQSNRGRENDYLGSKDAREYLYHLFKKDFVLLGYDRNN